MGKFIARFGDISSVMAALNERMFTFLSAADRLRVYLCVLIQNEALAIPDP